MIRVCASGEVEARQVTVQTLDSVAAWIGGQVIGVRLEPEDRAVLFSNYDHEEHEVNVGWWIVRYALANGTWYGLALSDEIFLMMFKGVEVDLRRIRKQDRG